MWWFGACVEDGLCLGQGTGLGWGENFYHTTNHGTNSAEKTMSILYALESAVVVVAGPPAVELVIYRLRLCVCVARG
jgi:hypothetical protein